MNEIKPATLTQRPGIALNRMHLTGLLIGIPVVFVLFALAMAKWVPAIPEPRLEASISIEVKAWNAPNKSTELQRLYPSIVLKNTGKEPWTNVAVSLNKQFYYYEPMPMESGKEVIVPLEQFVTKGGNVSFRPAVQEIHLLTVFGKLPSGDRGVLEQTVHWVPAGIQ